MIKFKVGYYYKWIGNKNNYYWDDERKLVFDNKWHKYIKTNKWTQFEDMKYGWCWIKDDFIESKYSPKDKVKKLLLDKK